MKKILTMILVGVMVFASVGSVFAEEPVDNQVKAAERKAMREANKAAKLEMLKELQDEIHQINALRIERHNIRTQIIEKHDGLLDLYIAAKESGNEEVLAAAKETRGQIKGIHEEIKALHEQVKTKRQSLKEAKKNKDVEMVETLANEIILLQDAIDKALENKAEVLDEVIDILS